VTWITCCRHHAVRHAAILHRSQSMRKLTILTMIWLLGPAFSAGAVETARHNHALARSKAQSIQRAAEPTPRLAAPVDSYRA